MKRSLIWITGSLLLCMALLSFSSQKAQAQAGVSVSFQTFYDDLSPYGQWIDDPEYGYVWSPEVEDDFRPYYSGGHWVMTEYGNTWVSDYDWGWAPFHYGRWAQSSSYGWIWVPGNEWGPAWVSWRSGGGCYGWAPMAPGISLDIALGSYYAPDDWWIFIPQQYIYANSYYNYWRGPRYNYNYIRNTNFINYSYAYNNYHYPCGPRRQEVERVLGGRVNVYNIRNEQRPGRAVLRNNTVNMFRPVVNRSPRTNLREAPRNLVRAERPVIDRTPVAGRNGIDRRNGLDRDIQPRNGRNDARTERQFNGRQDQRIAPADRNTMQRDQRINEGRMQRDPNMDRGIQSRDREDINRAQQERADRSRMMEQQRMERSQMQQRQMDQQRMERQNNSRPGVDRPQREWRRPEPQPVERSQPRMERPEPQQRVERPMPQQRMERPMPQQRMERPMPQQRMERPSPAQGRGFDHGGRR